MAQYVHDRFASAGIPAVEIEPVQVLLSNPVGSSLSLVNADGGGAIFTAALSEDILQLDETSDTWFRNHTYNGCENRHFMSSNIGLEVGVLTCVALIECTVTPCFFHI